MKNALVKKLAELLLLLFCLAGAQAATPNFIFVLIDDMGYADLSCYGEKRIETVHLDRLAAEGLRFTQFYVASPICSPSRTAFTTGQYPSRWRITSYLDNRQNNTRRGMAQWLDPKAPSLARILQKKGYATGHFGKWHMGGQRDVGEAPLIQEYGFDQSLTQFEGLGDRILPLLDAYDGKPPRKHALGSDNLGRGKITWMDRSKVTGAFVDRAIEFIESATEKNQPFYINVWPDDVHSPFFPPEALRKGTEKDELYRAVVKAMDDQLGELFNFVRQHPRLSTNTIILIASDNGPEPGAGSAGQFRGTKATLYEGGVREPFIVWAPGFMEKSQRGKVNETTVVSAMDLLPSLATLAGASRGAVEPDGQEMSGALLGKQKPERKGALMWMRPPDRPGPPRNPLPDLAIREGKWKLLMREDGSAVELYDLQKDPQEAENVAAEHPEQVSKLKTQLLDWRKTMPQPPLKKEGA